MSKRKRLTARMRRGADASIPYPGNVNQPDRKDPAWDQYHTFEHTINHELPDMRHEWKDNPRNEIGYGIPEPWGLVPVVPEVPKVASVRIAANKAVKLAVLLLGEKTPEKVIEAQARDFMGMPSVVMDRTLSRFSATQKFYAQDDEASEDDESEETACKASEELAEEVSDNPAPDAIKAEASEEAEETASEEAEETASEEAEETASEEAEETASEEAEEEAEEKACKASAKPKKVVAKKPVRKVQSNELDIELTSNVDSELDSEDEVDAELEELLDDTPELPVEVEDEIEAVTSSRRASKKGIKTLGGQPRVASDTKAISLESIWGSAPDVSDVFS